MVIFTDSFASPYNCNGSGLLLRGRVFVRERDAQFPEIFVREIPFDNRLTRTKSTKFSRIAITGISIIPLNEDVHIYKGM